MQGFATEAGTSGYRRRLGTRAARGHFKTWQGLRLSSVGIGTCLGAEEEATDRVYEDAVKRALQLGINVVDTSVSNGHQRCERSIGAALRALVAEGGIAREDVVLSSRAGLLPFDGTVPANPTAYFTETYVRTGVLKAADLVGRHCLTPRYLADQLDRVAVGVLMAHLPQHGADRGIDALEVIKWKNIFDLIEDAIDGCEDAGNTLERIVLKNG